MLTFHSFFFITNHKSSFFIIFFRINFFNAAKRKLRTFLSRKIRVRFFLKKFQELKKFQILSKNFRFQFNLMMFIFGEHRRDCRNLSLSIISPIHLIQSEVHFIKIWILIFPSIISLKAQFQLFHKEI
jgi:hypothetical protein